MAFFGNKKSTNTDNTKPIKYVNRQSLLGLLFAQGSAVLLHFSQAPIWLLLLAVVVFVWRLQILRSQWAFPNRFVRLCLVIFSMTAIVLYYKEWYALEPMVSLLVIAFLLKLLEVDQHRDGVILIFVGYFVTASAFLFDQGIVSTLLGIFVLWSLTACLVVLHGSHIQYLSRRTVRTVSILLIQSVPLMLLMLFVFPRIGALWSVPIQSSSAVTGVSDSMSPGDFSQLTRSRKLAFRVSFDDDRIPDPSQRYWRGLVFTEFDGRRWERSKGANLYKGKEPNKTEFIANGPTFNYEVILEPTNTPWIYSIPLGNTIDKKSIRSAANELWLRDPVTQRIKYKVSSALSYRTREREERLKQALMLPKGFNPRSIEMAQKWRRESISTENYIEKVLNFYNQSFTYTLSPPRLGQHTVDEFLFSTQSGFCEHFSSSFVVLMRAAGIPARVVAGYQGGEWNDADSYLLVRQYDAHAWAEVWFPNKGWVRVDPTAAVAPNRIEQGLLDTLSIADQDLLEPSALPSFDWLNRLSLKWDSLNYRWQSWVLSYDQDTQSDLLEKLLGEVTSTRLAILLIAPGVIMLITFGFFTLRNISKPTLRKVKLYQALTRRLERRGIHPIAGETLTSHCERAIQSMPDKKPLIHKLSHSINASLYSSEDDIGNHSYKTLKQLIYRL